ncbi:class I SAM-dependent methyltransferase [Sinorhizobium fredii]|uniref:hypothetical protein n=1 Tax=Rhizobium fredii TaxID=380 RepID=UPI0029588A86|nr:hypothetical protein [Sinorhizobium fredii]WOS66771.1 hypothetical protein SFGR64A_22575 [Sinorhizobium fredii GR64]
MATALGVTIHAIDCHQPSLDELRRRAEDADVASRIQTHCMDMSGIPSLPSTCSGRRGPPTTSASPTRLRGGRRRCDLAASPSSANSPGSATRLRPPPATSSAPAIRI